MVVIGVFVVLLGLGFLGFAGKLPLPKSSKDINYGSVTLWGTLPLQTMRTLITEGLRGETRVKIKYEEKNAASFTRDFTEALASGQGPDLIILPQEELIKNLNKLDPISYTTMTERDFRSTFLQEGEIFLRKDGIMALPFTLDPIVMYWNRDIFSNAGEVKPPVLWKRFYDLAPKITVSELGGNIKRSFVSFGGYRNISHAKEILSVLIMQAGSPIVATQNNALVPMVLAPGASGGENPVVSAIRFFTEFSRQEKGSYSWNSSLPESRTMFESGDLAVYFGYVSEYKSIQQRNPHLNFDVAVVPQAENATAKLTFGRMHGIGITLASKNPQGALLGALLFSGQNVVRGISDLTGLPPVRRDLYSVRPSDPVLSVAYDSAIISRAWYDPSPTETNDLFRGMIDDVVSGRLTVNQSLSVVHENMNRLLNFYK